MSVAFKTFKWNDVFISRKSFVFEQTDPKNNLPQGATKKMNNYLPK